MKNSRQSEIKSAPYSESERIRSSGNGICKIGIKKKKLMLNLKLKLKKQLKYCLKKVIKKKKLLNK